MLSINGYTLKLVVSNHDEVNTIISIPHLRIIITITLTLGDLSACKKYNQELIHILTKHELY